jgi:phenylpropionate dioxygenase-like ring-hydroxylating dioxygenase large terminal subunit
MISVGEMLRSGMFDSSTRDFLTADTLPPQCYTSLQFHEFEVEAIFRKEWLCLGHVGQIPGPGDYFTITVANDPLIVLRDESGEVRILSAVCRHRGMVLTEGSGHCDRLLVCPYHGWSYDLRGDLVAAPDMGRTLGFDKRLIRLPSLRAEVWKGFIFVTYTKDAEPLAAQLAAVEPIIEHYRIDDLQFTHPSSYTFDANWKILMENGIECYHCSRLHRGYHDCAPSHNQLPEPLPDHESVIVTQVRTTHRDAAFTPPTFKAPFPVLPDLTDDERHRMTWVAVLPNVLLSLQSDNVHYFLLTPTGPERVSVAVGWLYPHSTVAMSTFEELFRYQLEVHRPIIEQDRRACSGVQKGLHSSLATRGRLAWEEEPVAHFGRWLIERYRRGVIETARS